DSTNATEILTLLRSLPEAGRRSVVMVTHDAAAADYGDRLVRIRDGLIEDDVVTRAVSKSTDDARHAKPISATDRETRKQERARFWVEWFRRGGSPSSSESRG